MRVVAAILMLFVAAGCGSKGGAGDVVVDPNNPSNPTGPVDPTIPPPNVIPSTGRAEYVGQLTLNLAQELTSPLTIDVDFGATTGQVTGEATAFAGHTGTVFLTLGEIDRAPAAGTSEIEGRVSGTLKSGSDSQLVFGTFGADFIGDGQAALRGAVSGSVLTSGVQSTMSGAFQAGRTP